MNFNIENYKEFLTADWAISVFQGLLTLVIGWILIKAFVNTLRKTLEKKNFDPSLTPFLTNMLKWLLRAVLLVIVAGTVGIETTSLAAILGAAGLAIGLALQGTLGHFASGILILLSRPIRVGDFVEVDGKQGTVKEIKIFQTILETLQGNTIYVPNGNVISNAITNVTEKPTRRIDFDFGISYDDDIRLARKIILDEANSDSRILQDPPVVAPVVSLGDSSVNLQLRAWVNTGDYWDARFDLIERIKTRFDENGITIPYPQSEMFIKGGKFKLDN